MQIDHIGSRGVRFTFEDEISIYLISTDHRLFLCDTHLGPDSMATVKEYIEAQGWGDKELIVFNSHSDWDHIWGNCAFPSTTLIGHRACRERMKERGVYDLQQARGEFRKGEIEINLPNLTFEQHLAFEDDKIEFIYAPGHTVCSAVCLDRLDRVVYVGDLLERPIPYALHHDLQAFIDTLQMIKTLPADTFVTAHSGTVEQQLIDDTIVYLQNLRDQKPAELDARVQGLHRFNRNNVLVLTFEQRTRDQLGDRFDFPSFMADLAGILGAEDAALVSRRLRSVDYEELKQALERYVAGLA